MLHLKLILMLTLVTASESYFVKGKLSLCNEKYYCFAPEKCLDSDANESQELSYEIRSPKIALESACPVLFKIRTFSKNKRLIVLQSFDPNVKQIILEKGNTTIECTTDFEVVMATYNENEQELINSQISPLMCEFLLETESDVFPDVAKALFKIFTEHGPKFIIHNDYIQVFLSSMKCVPMNAITQNEGSIGDKMVTRLEEATDSMDLICKPPYYVSYRENNASEFKRAQSLKCAHGEGKGYGYHDAVTDPKRNMVIPTPFDAQCEALTCTLCTDVITKSMCLQEPMFKIFTADKGCKELKCANGGRIKLLDTANLFDKAECKYLNGSIVYTVDGDKAISDETGVECITSVECNEDLARKVCNDCVVDKQNLPQCSRNLQLTYYNKAVKASCNGNNGETYLTNLEDGEESKLEEDDVLSCELNTKVACSDELAQTVCIDCVVDKQNLPQCSTNLQLTHNGNAVKASCNSKSGETFVTNLGNGKESKIGENDILSCLPKTVECSEQLAHTVCSDCVVDTGNLPQCSASLQLTYNGSAVNVSCDSNNGETIVNYLANGTEFQLKKGDKLSCKEIEKKTEKVACSEKLARKLCSDCVVDKQNLPQCSRIHQLTHNGSPIKISCNNDNGETYATNLANLTDYALGKGDKLSCAPKTSVECNEKLAQKVCSDCVVDKNNLPQCSANVQLTHKGNAVRVWCKSEHGATFVTNLSDGKEYQIRQGDKLSCALKAAQNDTIIEQSTPSIVETETSTVPSSDTNTTVAAGDSMSSSISGDIDRPESSTASERATDATIAAENSTSIVDSVDIDQTGPTTESEGATNTTVAAENSTSSSTEIDPTSEDSNTLEDLV